MLSGTSSASLESSVSVQSSNRSRRYSLHEEGGALLALLPNSRPIFYTTILPTYAQAYCREISAAPYSIAHECANGDTVQVLCPAEGSAVIAVRCPGYESRPHCYVYAANSVSPDSAPGNVSSCSVVEYSPLNRTCLCAASNPPVSWRRLGWSAASSSSSAIYTGGAVFSATLVCM